MQDIGGACSNADLENLSSNDLVNPGQGLKFCNSDKCLGNVFADLTIFYMAELQNT